MTNNTPANIVGSRSTRTNGIFPKTALILVTCAVFLILACSPELPVRSPISPTPTPIPPQVVRQTAPAPPLIEVAAQPSPAADAETEVVPTTTRPQSPSLSPTRTSTPAPKPETAGPTVLLVAVAKPDEDMTTYDRQDWRHWIDEDGDCQDSRQEVLIAESLSSVTYRSDRECRVVAGQWFAPYTGRNVLDPGDLDIDHMVPLANAHRSGAWIWTEERKREYANYLDDKQHLIAVTAGANRSKGAKGPEEWRPPDQSYWCRYAIDWTTIKMQWGLTVSQAEFAALEEMLSTCESPYQLAQVVTMERPGFSSPMALPTATHPSPAPVAVYESCEAAQAEGVPRTRGTQGAGRGFPKELVPSARDGDGDGVVCEQ